MGKAQKMLAAQSASRSKGKKKKWSGPKVREKKNHAVMFTQSLYDRVLKGTLNLKVITVYNLVENFKINGSLARKAIRALLEKNEIRAVAVNQRMSVCAPVAKKEKKVEATEESAGKKKKAPKKSKKQKKAE